MSPKKSNIFESLASIMNDTVQQACMFCCCLSKNKVGLKVTDSLHLRKTELYSPMLKILVLNSNLSKFLRTGITTILSKSGQT